MDHIRSTPHVDRISNLPENVIENILNRLKTHDAAKTCVWSKEWKYRWVKLPHLIFDGYTYTESARTKFVIMLYEVILHHQGPITKLSLTVCSLGRCVVVDHLIKFASKNGVEEFTFDVGEGYKLPCSLFMCSWLKHLNLSSCLIRPPPTFKGFDRLITLKLCNVIIDNEVLQNLLLSSSRLLEELVLSVGNKIDCLNIDAPMLKLFEMKCSAYSVCFKRPCPLLAIVSAVNPVSYLSDKDFFRADEQSRFVQFFESLPALEKLHMDFYFLKNLAAAQLQTSLPANLAHLKILKLSHVSFTSVNEVAGVLCLIRITPKLEELHKEFSNRSVVDYNGVQDFLKLQDYSDVYFSRLQNVKLELICGEVAISLIKLLLGKSLALKKMMISINYRDEPDSKIWILQKLNDFERASPYAKVSVDVNGI